MRETVYLAVSKFGRHCYVCKFSYFPPFYCRGGVVKRQIFLTIISTCGFISFLEAIASLVVTIALTHSLTHSLSAIVQIRHLTPIHSISYHPILTQVNSYLIYQSIPCHTMQYHPTPYCTIT